jgi:hypothetical protein
LFDSSDVDPAEIAAATARCYLALGRLDGAIAHAAPSVVALFALMLVHRTLARSLAAAGYLFTDATFEGWISRAGGPPQGGPGTAAPAPAIAAAVLSELRASRWPALAEAADLVSRAASHLGRGGRGTDVSAPNPTDSEALEEGQGARYCDGLGGVIAAARAVLIDGEVIAAEHDAAPLSVLAERLAKVPALFAPVDRGTAVIETDIGPVAVPLATQQSQGWALGLVVGEMLVNLGMMRQPFPFAGVIVPQVLRSDCDPNVRLLRLASDIGQCAHELLGDLETARRLVSRAEAALVDARSTSRAPAVFALIAGLGLVTRGEVCDAFRMTAAGADGVLGKLLAAGLIVRRSGRAGGFCVAAKAGTALGSKAEGRIDALGMEGVNDLASAMDGLDRLLRSQSVRLFCDVFALPDQGQPMPTPSASSAHSTSMPPVLHRQPKPEPLNPHVWNSPTHSPPD